MKICSVVICFALMLFTLGVKAQEFSNKGKDFWLGYGYHVRMAVGQNPNSDNGQDLVLYFTSDQDANVTVSIPGVGYARTYIVKANQVTISEPIPKSGNQDARINNTGLFNAGIHITSDRSVVAYAHIYNQNVSGASVLFPTNTLGKDYYSLNFDQSSNETESKSFFFVVATEDNTTIEITASASNENGLPIGIPTVLPTKLNKGQIYNVMGTVSGNTGADLTGSRVRSISATGANGGCKPIAVFSGTGKISIGGNGRGSSDNLFAQAFPSNAWGTRYLTAPTGGQPNNFFRVCVKDPSTIVKLNGVQISAAFLRNGFYYQFKNGNQGGTNSPIPNLIEADKPILVAQYCTTQGFEGNGSPGDPEMIYLSPVEQTINKITLYSASQFSISQSYINVIIKNEGVSSFKLDGLAPSSGSFLTHPGDPNYSYATLMVGSGMSHSLYSDSGFNAIAYGFGNAESYGYNAGTNIVDLNPPINIRNDFASSGITYSATCTNAPFKVYVSIPYEANKLVVDFGSNASLISGTNPYTHIPTNGKPDSTYLSNGKTYNVYFIPVSYKFGATGTFPITITATTTVPQSDGCSNNNDQEINDNIIVNDPPIADFSITTSGCVNTNVSFTDQGNGFGRPFYKWTWDFGGGVQSTLQNPTRLIGAYISSVKLTSIIDYGCVASVTKTLDLSNKPVANFSFTSPNCVNTAVLFTDKSTITASPNNNKIATWIWNFNNGNAADTVFTNTNQQQFYSTDGAKSIGLLVKSNTGCPSDPYQPLFSIKPTPVASFKLPEVCLSDAFAPFNDESTISDGTGNLITRKWTFAAGVPATSTIKSPQIRYPAPGEYTATLEVNGSTGCADTLTQKFYVNGSNPIADFEVVNTIPICQPAPIKIKNKSSVDIGNITRIKIYWDYINNPTQKETDENPVADKIYAHTYIDLQLPAAQQYTIRMVAYSGGGSCVNAIEKIIQVYPQPKASFITSAAQICAGQSINFQNLSNGVSSAPLNWNWSFGSAGTNNLRSPIKTFPDSGMYNIKLFFTNNDGCTSDTATSPITVHPNPVVYLKDSVTLILGASITLSPDSLFGNNLSYLWSPSTYLDNPTVVAPVSTAEDDITYTLTLTGIGGCTASDQISILVLRPPQPPNAFSPNGDGINDTWAIKYLNRYPEATVDVYDRYGQRVFQSLNYTTPWDGYLKGKPVGIGTYYYIINPKNGLPILSGSVTVLK